MKWLVLLLPGGCVALVVWELVRRHRDRRERQVSPDWLRERGQRASRIDFVSVGWRWPLDKLALDGEALSDCERERARFRRTA